MSTGSETLSRADAAWLRMDRPTNLMVINGVLLFDEQLHWQRLEQVVRERLVAPYPRFRERVIESRLGLGEPRFVTDADFDLARHMHRRGLREPGDEQALKELAGDLAATPLDRGKPLWDMYLVDGPGEGSAVIVRMHHCIADGIALAQVMLSLTDPEPGTARWRPLPHHAPAQPRSRALAGAPLRAGVRLLSAAVSPVAGALALGARAAQSLAVESLRTLARPQHARELRESASADARALGKLLFTGDDADSVLRQSSGAPRAVAWSRPISLDQVKAIAHGQRATVNDVLLAAVSGALRDYLLARGEEPHEIRAMVPVNLRPAGEPIPAELGNRFGLVFVSLPVDRAGQRERLLELKRRMDEI